MMTNRFNKIKSSIISLLITILCTMPFCIINSQSNLGVLPQEPNSRSSTLSTSSGLSALLASSTVPLASADLQAGLLQQFVTVQSNPLYIKAMNIINDRSLKEIYSNTLLSIQLFFMQYATDDLSKLSAESAVTHKPSLSLLLNTALSTSAISDTNSGAVGLASLLSTNQSVGQSGITLLKKMSELAPSVPESKKLTTGLQRLLDVVSVPSINSLYSGSTVPTKSLSTLLAVQD